MDSGGPSCFDLYFVGRSNDPRNVQVIGFEGSNPILYSFETISVTSQTRTTITQGSGDMVALFDWTNGTHLGLCSLARNRKFAMAFLVDTGSTSFSRSFRHKSSVYEWRRIASDAYDLYSADNTRLALFRSKRQGTPVGDSHGYMQYSFHSHESLLLDSLLALCVNRWIDKNGL